VWPLHQKGADLVATASLWSASLARLHGRNAAPPPPDPVCGRAQCIQCSAACRWAAREQSPAGQSRPSAAETSQRVADRLEEVALADKWRTLFATVSKRRPRSTVGRPWRDFIHANDWAPLSFRADRAPWPLDGRSMGPNGCGLGAFFPSKQKEAQKRPPHLARAGGGQ